MSELTDPELTLVIRAVEKSLIQAERNGRTDKAEHLQNALLKLDERTL